jgi:hypothetical protein
MQQAHPVEQSTVDTHGGTLPGAAPLNAFVINLCSSTSPVALAPPDHAGLKRFSFFVSRRREESRERFRLHMGYFDTQEEAEKLLDIVREIYPGAWAGLAPGQRLRAAAAQGGAAAAPISAAEVAPAQLEPLPGSTAAAMAADVVVGSAPAAASATTAATSATAETAAPAAAADNVDGTTVSVSTRGLELLQDAALALVPDQGRRMPEVAIPKPEVVAATRSLNDVRAAIASLEDTSERAPLLRPLPELKPVARAAGAAHDDAEPISAKGVLAVLEQGAPAASGKPVALAGPAAVRAGARASKAPEEQAQPRTEKPYFAVQLMWSVQPMDVSQVPQLAIFSAYTLYGAEGNRDGRRWYGLRLGFFTDAVSAKQVAHYVRSEFSTVSVVPVTARERERAHLASGRPPLTAPAKPGVDATAAPNAAALATPKTKFEFIEDREPGLPVAKPGAGVPRAAGRAPGKRAKLRTQGTVNGRSRTKPMTLEETLEILGAGELKMDEGRGPLINDSSVAQPRLQPAKNKASRLGRLFERLSERLGS